MYDNPDYGRPKGAGQNGLIVRDAWIFQNPNNSGCLNIDIFVVKIICSSASSSKSYVDVCRYSSVSLIVGVVIIIVVHRLVGTSSWLIVGIVIGITDCSFIHRQIFIGIGVGMSIQMQSSASSSKSCIDVCRYSSACRYIIVVIHWHKCRYVDTNAVIGIGKSSS